MGVAVFEVKVQIDDVQNKIKLETIQRHCIDGMKVLWCMGIQEKILNEGFWQAIKWSRF
jgi:hypothetical protein